MFRIIRVDACKEIQTQPKVLFECTVELDFHASQKNGKRIFTNSRTGKQFLGTSSRVQKAKNLLLLQLRTRAREAGIAQPIGHRVHTVLLFGFPHDRFYTKQLRESRTLGDCSNLSQIVEDALQKAGIIENDCFLAPLFVDRIPTDKTCVYIKLTSYVS